MKRLAHNLQFILFIYFLLMPYAFAKNTLQFSITGLQGEILKNAQAALAVELKAHGELSVGEINKIYQRGPALI